MVEKFSSRRCHIGQWILGDEHGQEDGEGTDHAGDGSDEYWDGDEKLPEVDEDNQTQSFVKPHLAVYLNICFKLISHQFHQWICQFSSCIFALEIKLLLETDKKTAALVELLFVLHN